MPHYILIQVEDLQHHSGDIDDISIGVQTLLEATGIPCEVNVMSSGQLYDHFNLIENPTEGGAVGRKTESSHDFGPNHTEDDLDEDANFDPNDH